MKKVEYFKFKFLFKFFRIICVNLIINRMLNTIKFYML